MEEDARIEEILARYTHLSETLVAAYVDQALASEGRLAVDHHLAWCVHCRDWVRDVQEALDDPVVSRDNPRALQAATRQGEAATPGPMVDPAARRLTHLRLLTRATQRKVNRDPLKLAAQDSPAQWPVLVDAELEDGEHVVLTFQPSGFALAVTLSPDSRGPVVVTSGRMNREVVLAPGVAAGLGTLFETKLTAASSPEELLRQLDVTGLSIRRA